MFTVLIVDDDLPIAHCLLIDQLNMIGITVKEAVDGEAGLELFKKFQPDFTITDTNMPKLNGPDMVRKILEINPEALILSCSGNPRPNLRFSEGIPFHQKPIPVELVLEMLKI